METAGSPHEVVFRKINRTSTIHSVRHRAHEFEDPLGGTDIGRAPAAECGCCVVGRFDFSAPGPRGACEQPKGHLADEGLRHRAPSMRYVGLAVGFHGWELAACEAMDPGADDGEDRAVSMVTRTETA